MSTLILTYSMSDDYIILLLKYYCIFIDHAYKTMTFDIH